MLVEGNLFLGRSRLALLLLAVIHDAARQRRVVVVAGSVLRGHGGIRIVEHAITPGKDRFAVRQIVKPRPINFRRSGIGFVNRFPVAFGFGKAGDFLNKPRSSRLRSTECFW